MVLDIKILHASCCAKNAPIKARIEDIALKNNLSIKIEEFSELKDTMQYGTMNFPSIVVNNKVYDYKKYVDSEKLLAILQ